MPKVLSYDQLMKKQYSLLENLRPDMRRSFGGLPDSFRAIIYGESGNGKTSFLLQFLAELLPYGKILYNSLEEGFERSMQKVVSEHLGEAARGIISFGDHEMTYDELVKKLKRRKGPKFVIIDSIQYWDCDYEKYKQLKAIFPKKTFIFISHAQGKSIIGKTAFNIRHDVGLKIRVEGYIAFVISRYGGNEPFVIWEEGAKRYWGKKYKSITRPMSAAKKSKPKPTEENEPDGGV